MSGAERLEVANLQRLLHALTAGPTVATVLVMCGMGVMVLIGGADALKASSTVFGILAGGIGAQQTVKRHKGGS